MENKKTEDWLPAGWTMEVRVRKDGRQDKCYFAPSSGLQFNSRVQVSRYLSNSHPVPEKKRRGLHRETAKEVVVKKVVAEGLPPGWMKEIKLTKKGRKIRRDPYYTDPVSGYVFRSMKDVSRYLGSGELGPYAFKPKNKGSRNVELEDDSSCSPAIGKDQKLDVDVTRRHITGDQASKLCEMVKNEARDTLACTEECMASSEHSSDQWEKELLSSELPENKDLKQIERGSDSTIVMTTAVPEDLKRSELQDNKDLRHKEQVGESATNMPPADHGVDIMPNVQSLKTRMSSGESKRTDPDKRKSKKKIYTQLPRRASKRLAGITLEPVPELKTANGARLVTVRHSDGAAAGAAQDYSIGHVGCQNFLQCDELESEQKVRCSSSMFTGMSLDLDKTNHFAGNLANLTEVAGKEETKVKDDKKQGRFAVSTHKNLTIMKDHSIKVESEINTSDKTRDNLSLPLAELWSDPCIAFAIQTLTGVAFDASTTTEGSLGSNNSRVVASNVHESHKEEGGVNEADKKQVSTGMPLENLHVPEELARKVEINDKAPEKPGSPLNFPSADVWTDPCIDFAIKTLTGAIPLDCDMVTQDCFSQQVGSSQSQEGSGSTLPNVGEFCRTALLCQQYAAVDKSSAEKQALVEHAFPVTGNLNIENADRTNQHQLDEVQRNGYQR